MEQNKESVKKLWLTVGLLALSIALAVFIDSWPYFDKIDSEPDPADKRPGITEIDMELYEGITLPKEGAIRLSFIGECAPGSPFGTQSYGSLNTVAASEGKDYFFRELLKFFNIDHLTVASNACIFSDHTEDWVDAATAAPAENITVYTEGGVDVIVDLHRAAAASIHTEESILAAGLVHLPSDSAYYFEQNGITVAVCTAILTENSPRDSITDMVEVVRQDADYVVLYFYGGETNSHQPEEWLKEILHLCADAGASLIVGAGNGVLRPVEVYNETLIAYSLGEMINGSHLVPENAALVLQVDLSFTDDGNLRQEVTYIPCFAYGNLWQPTIMTERRDTKQLHAFLNGEVLLPVSDNAQ